MDTSAARHHAEKQNPDASVPSAYSPGSANFAKASVPALTHELREHAGGPTRATNSELGSGEVAMDTSAARHHAEKQNPDASVPSAYSPGSAILRRHQYLHSLMSQGNTQEARPEQPTQSLAQGRWQWTPQPQGTMLKSKTLTRVCLAHTLQAPQFCEGISTFTHS